MFELTIDKNIFGYTKNGEEVDCYKLADDGITVEVLTYGGAVRSIVVPVGDGVRDVALGFDSVADYEGHSSYIGALIGRVGNRIGNARFSLGGKSFSVDANEGPNCLHGGFQGFDRRVWNARELKDCLALSLNSADLECGFPGNMAVEVRYSLKDGALIIEYIAECDEDTPISLTNHCYFNLGGHDSGNIENHRIQIFAQAITPVDERLIPTGELLDVTSTPFDLREPKTIGSGIAALHPQLALGSGYDHNYVLSKLPHQDLALSAILEYDGLKMTCHTTQPGLQFYSGNHLTELKGKDGATYSKRSGLCLETQSWPDAINHPEFPNSILRKNETYRHTTEYKFS